MKFEGEPLQIVMKSKSMVSQETKKHKTLHNKQQIEF